MWRRARVVWNSTGACLSTGRARFGHEQIVSSIKPGTLRAMSSFEPEGYVPPTILSLADFATRGVSRAEVGRRVSSGELCRLRSGLYVERGQVAEGLPAYEAARRDFIDRTLAAALSIEPGTVLSHGSALALYGLPLYDVPLDRPTATRHRAGGGTRRSSVLACANLPLEGVVREIEGIAVTSPARSIVDVARTVSVESGLCAADEAIRRKLCTPVELQAQVDAARGRTGVARARVIPEMSSGLSESVLESLIKLTLLFSGLPAPELQVRLGVRGGQRFRVDFFWRDWRLIGEADGFGKYGTGPDEIRRNWAAERRRQQQLEEEGYVVIRWTWADLRHPQRIVARVQAEMRRQERLGLGKAA